MRSTPLAMLGASAPVRGSAPFGLWGLTAPLSVVRWKRRDEGRPDYQPDASGAGRTKGAGFRPV